MPGATWFQTTHEEAEARPWYKSRKREQTMLPLDKEPRDLSTSSTSITVTAEDY